MACHRDCHTELSFLPGELGLPDSHCPPAGNWEEYVVRSKLGNSQRFGVGSGEDWDLSGVLCHKVYPPKHPFFLRGLTSVVCR